MEGTLEVKSSLVEKYINRAKQEKQDVRERLEKIGIEGLPVFEKNVEIWLASLKEEIDEIQTPFFEFESIDLYHLSVSFRCIFTWNGCEGIITTSGWGVGWKTHGPGTFLKMAVKFGNWERYESMKLSVDQRSPNENGDYTDIALPIDEIALGKMLVNMIRHLDQAKQETREREERNRRNLLTTIEHGFDQLDDIPAVQKYLAQICASNPDELDRWNAAAKRRTLAITAEQQRQRELQAQVALEEIERDRLAKMAAELFRPFTVFKISIAVLFRDEAETRLFHIFTTAAVPDEAGWFTRVMRGQLIPNYRPDNVVDITRVEIDTVDHPDAPEVCEHRELSSTELPYISEIALATPKGLGE